MMNIAVQDLGVAPPIGKNEDEGYSALIHRLSVSSVNKHFDAYADIDWDCDAFRVDPSDERWALTPDDPLGATAWYQALPRDVQSKMGLHIVASFAKIGLEFENILKRGLLEFASELKSGSPEFRYVYHEVIEEAQHGLMFQEFVNRTGLPIEGLDGTTRALARHVVSLGRRFPALFFFFVLGGEDPIDHVQRVQLGRRDVIHPLIKRIMQIHVTEEARHLCFARHYLKRRVPRLGGGARVALSLGIPVILGVMAKMMLMPPKAIIEAYGVPESVVAEAYTNNPKHKQKTFESLAKVRALCEELGLLTPAAVRVWRSFGIWAETNGVAS